MTEPQKWSCPSCGYEYTSPSAAAICAEDDEDRHNTRGYD